MCLLDFLQKCYQSDVQCTLYRIHLNKQIYCVQCQSENRSIQMNCNDKILILLMHVFLEYLYVDEYSMAGVSVHFSVVHNWFNSVKPVTELHLLNSLFGCKNAF